MGHSVLYFTADIELSQSLKFPNCWDLVLISTSVEIPAAGLWWVSGPKQPQHKVIIGPRYLYFNIKINQSIKLKIFPRCKVFVM